MREALFAALGYVIGVVVSWIVMRPDRVIKKAMEEAEKTFTNWGDGFQNGWEGAAEAMYAITLAALEEIKERKERERDDKRDL